MPDKKATTMFEYIDFHDCTLVSIEIMAGEEESQSSVVIKLSQHWTEKRIQLSFIACKNIELGLDFDIVKDNFPCNVEGLSVTGDVNERMRFLRKQQKLWNVSYNRRGNPSFYKRNPGTLFNLYRLNIFGGTMKFLAERYLVE